MSKHEHDPKKPRPVTADADPPPVPPTDPPEGPGGEGDGDDGD